MKGYFEDPMPWEVILGGTRGDKSGRMSYHRQKLKSLGRKGLLKTKLPTHTHTGGTREGTRVSYSHLFQVVFSVSASPWPSHLARY